MGADEVVMSLSSGVYVPEVSDVTVEAGSDV